MFKLEKELHIYLKTFLVFLEFIPEDGIMDEIPLDNKIIMALRAL